VLLMLDAFKRASAMRITAVMPIMDTPPGPQSGAARADQRELVADLITIAGASRMLTLGLHSGRFRIFRYSVDNVYATPVLLDY